MLTAISCALLWVYNASVDSLIHLYVIGVFTAFTLSQAGMVRYWLRSHDPAGGTALSINTVGASATGLVTLIVVWTKFGEGAWLVIVAIPLLVAHLPRHQSSLPAVCAAPARRPAGAVSAAGTPTNDVLVWVDAIDVATEGALWYARQIAPEARLRALHVPRRHTDTGIRARWWDLAGDEPRLELPPGEGCTDRCSRRSGACPAATTHFVTVVVPEQFRRPSLLSATGAGFVPRQVAPPLRARRGRRRRSDRLVLARA